MATPRSNSISGEEWRRVDGFGDYEVSNAGRVRSFKRPGAPAILSLENNYGYRRAHLHSASTGVTVKHMFVHRLVLTAFRGPRGAGQETRHLNGNRADNRLGNLAWGTRADQMADQLAHGTRMYGEKNPSAKMTATQVMSIREQFSEGRRQFDLARDYRMSLPAINAIIRRRTWTHI